MMMAQGGVSLPSGYTKIEYLESDGNHYIDTGFKPKYNTRVVLDMSNLTEADKWILGAKSSSSQTSAEQFSICRRTATTIRSDYFGSSVSADMADTTTRFTIDVDWNVVKIDGVVSIVNTAVTSGTCGYNMYLFGINIANTSKELSAFRIYSCRIYDNGVLVRDFIPCTNPDGISGLWDSVNDVFYKLLPADYTRLDFIESDGTTYIDTGFKPNQDTRVVMDVELNSQSSYPKVLFGARNGSTTSDASFIVWAITANGFRTDFGSESLVTTVAPTGRFVIDKNKNVTSFNGIEYTNPAYTFQCDYNIGLFTQIDVDGPDNRVSAAKLYSCKIYDNGTLVRDFIPAMNASGEAGLYDLKNDVWYALLPVAKPRVENKIKLTLRREYDTTVDGLPIVIIYGTLTSEEEVASDVKAAIYNSSTGSNALSSLTIKEGANSSNGYSLLGLQGDYYITSISPTEDDTYIYTF